VLPLPGSDLSIRRDSAVNVWATVIEQVTPRRTAKKIRSASAVRASTRSLSASRGSQGSETCEYPTPRRHRTPDLQPLL